MAVVMRRSIAVIAVQGFIIYVASLRATTEAFMMQPHHHHKAATKHLHKYKHHTSIILRSDNHHDFDVVANVSSLDKQRRKLISVAPSALLPYLLIGGDNTVSAASEVVTEAAVTPPTSIKQTNVATSLSAPSRPRTTTLCADSEEENRIAIFERVAPSVVYIDTFSEKRDVFSTNVMEVPIGSGSGFIWDNEGHIVTNFHVIQQAKSAQVAILTPNNGGRPSTTIQPAYTSSARPGALGIDGSTVLKDFSRSVYKAKVVGVDPTKDIAVLKVEKEDNTPIKQLRPIQLGTSTGLRVGQGSLAIGNPFGLDHTLTTGVISGIGREVKSPSGRPISNVIQTDAAINPGNSGGPLLDSSGKVIGMATAIYSPSGASAGVGFAIPSDTVNYIVTQLIENGQIVRPLLGVSILDSKQSRQALGITKGVLILEVKPGTPAAAAGLKGLRRTDSGIIEIGDIIIAVEGKPIENEGDLFKAIEDYKPGDIIKVTVNRPQIEITEDGEPDIKLKEITFAVKLIASDDSTFLQK
jgi:S1-C subfamily serine protease